LNRVASAFFISPAEMSLRLAVVLAALVVCATATTPVFPVSNYLNFGTYAENFQPAPGFVLTTVNDASDVLRSSTNGLLQTSTVIVVKVGQGVVGIREGQTVFPTLQRGIDATGAFTEIEDGVDTRAYCPQPLNINPATFVGPQTVSSTSNDDFIPNPIGQVVDELLDEMQIAGRYCIYHESQIAAVINNQAVRGTPGSSHIFNSHGFVANIQGTTRPTL